MATEDLNYFYDAQIRRYMIQISRIFSNFYYKTGKQSDGNQYLRRVVAKHAHKNRQAAHVMRNNSTNTIFTTPAITFYISDIEMAPDMRQNPTHVQNEYFTEKKIDPETQEYTSEPGVRHKVTRYMPVPYYLTINVDIWTSNQMQKEQLLEQILIIFNPSIDLQITDNPFDWTSLTILKLNGITWSSKSIPVGTDDEIDVASLTFTGTIWLTPPAVMEEQNLIGTVVQNIKEIEAFEQAHKELGTDLDYSEYDLMARIVTTPGNHKISIDGEEITLLNSGGIETDKDGNIFRWKDLIESYGELRPSVSQIEINLSSDIENDSMKVIGYIEYSPINENKLIWTIDPMTLPENTLDPIDAIINPMNIFPGNGIPGPQQGQRYLLTYKTIPESDVWGNVQASENDIIEYNGNQWFISFKASKENADNIVFNKKQKKQLLWDGEDWQYAIDAVYNEGFWRLKL